MLLEVSICVCFLWQKPNYALCILPQVPPAVAIGQVTFFGRRVIAVAAFAAVVNAFVRGRQGLQIAAKAQKHSFGLGNEIRFFLH